ncbi:pyruvate kinase, partial [Campylobacter jejuni]
DGSIRAKVVNIDDQKIETIIENDGFLNSNKGINFPNTKINIDVITQKDKNDLLWGIKNEVDFLAISFVQNAHDIDEVREILAQNNAKISIFAKIEKFDAVENIDEIIKSSDGIMVARGDLGIEVPYYKVPNIQKEIIQKANNASKPVITATQMLFSLAKSKTATRAEISDVANAVLDGTDAVMLSEESAVGIDPANAVDIMCQTIIETEKRYPYNKFNDFNDLDNTDKIMRSSAHLATDLNADAIFSLTSSGKSAIKIARYRPNIEIIAVGHSEKTLNSLSIVWGVNPAILVNKSNELTELLKDSVRSSVEKGFMDEDKCYLLTAGFPTGVEGTSNLIRILNKEQIAYYLQ